MQFPKFGHRMALSLLAASFLTGAGLMPANAQSAQELVLGVIGNSKDMAQPYSPTRSASAASLYAQLYDGLSAHDAKGGIVMQLAESMTPNSAMDVWTVKLRQGILRHDGKQFTADDVIASVQYMLDPTNNFVLASELNFVDPQKLRKIDDLTVEFQLKHPFGLFANVFADRNFKMRGIGADGKDVGTGPFTLDSFTPGQEARLTRFDSYWGEKPGFEKLHIIDFRDQQALTNALRGGQIDVAYSVPYSDVETLLADPQLSSVVSDTTSYPILAARVDLKPFNNPKVLEALKLVVDRQQIVDNAFGGHGKIANDYLGNNTACPGPDVAQRKQNIEKARQLLSEAGASDLKIELVTDGAYAGMMEMGQLFAQQAAQAGIQIKVRRLDPATFLGRWRDWPFIVGLTGGPYETATLAALLPDHGENATHFDDPEYNDLAQKLQQSSDPAEQCSLVAQMQAIEYARSGNIVPAYSLDIAVFRKTVVGLKPDLYGRTPIQFSGVTLSK